MNTIFCILTYAMFVACTSAFLLLLAYKWGIVEWFQVHGGAIVSKMANCDFCMSWWLCLFLSLVIVNVTSDGTLLLVPFVSTPIARRML